MIQKEYKKPTIEKQVIKVNYFYSGSRYHDSIDMLQGSYLLSQGSGSDTCFLPGTQILMADGNYKKIQDIKELDPIMSLNIVGNEIINNKVSKLIEKTYNEGYLLINGKLKITLNHKVWVNNKEWVEAQNIKVGDILLNSQKKEITVDKIEVFKGVFKVYNLHIEGKEHNFFAEDILVHNEIYECS